MWNRLLQRKGCHYITILQIVSYVQILSSNSSNMQCNLPVHRSQQVPQCIHMQNVWFVPCDASSVHIILEIFETITSVFWYLWVFGPNTFFQFLQFGLTLLCQDVRSSCICLFMVAFLQGYGWNKIEDHHIGTKHALQSDRGRLKVKSSNGISKAVPVARRHLRACESL